jgi:hypothetical protein
MVQLSKEGKLAGERKRGEVK